MRPAGLMQERILDCSKQYLMSLELMGLMTSMMPHDLGLNRRRYILLQPRINTTTTIINSGSYARSPLCSLRPQVQHKEQASSGHLWRLRPEIQESLC